MQELLLSAAMIHGCGLEGAALNTVQNSVKTYAFHTDYRENMYNFRCNGLGFEVESKSEKEITVQFTAARNLSKRNPYFNQAGRIKWNATSSPYHFVEPYLEISQFVVGFTTQHHEECSIKRTAGKIGLAYSFFGSDLITPSFQIGAVRDLRHDLKFTSVKEFEGYRIDNKFSIEAMAVLSLNNNEKYNVEFGGKYEYGFDNHRRAMETFISLQRRF